jgi:hypothetical protein
MGLETEGIKLARFVRGLEDLFIGRHPGAMSIDFGNLIDDEKMAATHVAESSFQQDSVRRQRNF